MLPCKPTQHDYNTKPGAMCTQDPTQVKVGVYNTAQALRQHPPCR
jgi:hypothetical protein